MLTADRTTHISKFLSLVLRHKPQEIGILLDDAGWVDIEVLLEAMACHGTLISRAELDYVVATNDKKRFAISEDGLRIRASQGHSVQINLGLDPVTPPEVLYHGTADRFVASIRQSGLQKRNRQYVHLSATTQTATSVGQRHGRPIILIIRSGDMFRTEHQFYLSANQVWLTEAVPLEFIQFPE